MQVQRGSFCCHHLRNIAVLCSPLLRDLLLRVARHVDPPDSPHLGAQTDPERDRADAHLPSIGDLPALVAYQQVKAKAHQGAVAVHDVVLGFARRNRLCPGSQLA